MTTVGIVIGALLLALFIAKAGLGIVVIGSNEVGIVTKKFSSKKLESGKIVALNGEAGVQADTLAPGWHFFYFSWQFSVRKVHMIDVPAGELALIVARDGKEITNGRMLGAIVDSDNFQNARKFLENGGQKGRQMGILTAGSYRINTELFDVITSENAKDYGVSKDSLYVFNIATDEIGVVTTLDGSPVREGEIAGKKIPGHENFQNPQVFIDNGGERGLQEQVLQSGSYTLNPWFVAVEIEEVSVIDIGQVGVVISYVGAEHKDISGDAFKHGDLVETGHKGVWAVPLNPGKHALNSRTVKLVKVPTTNIALNWSDTKNDKDHGLDNKLKSLSIRSSDGFTFNLDITQVIHVGSKQAPRVISRFGTMEKLINQVLEPAIDNYFRNSAQKSDILAFLGTRVERQDAALAFVREALAEYDIEAVGTYIGNVLPPEELMKTQTDKKLAEERKVTYKVQEETQKALQSLQKEEALAQMQSELVSAEQQINIEKSKASAALEKARGESESVKVRAQADANSVQMKGEAEAKTVEAVGMAKAKVYEASVKAMGEDNYSRLQIVTAIADKNLKIIPDTLIMGGGEGGGSLMLQTLLTESVTGQRFFPTRKESNKEDVVQA